LARTALNKQAGEWLRAVRGKKRSGTRFAANLSLVLETPIAPATLYAWESGTRTVPAAVLLAASRLTGQPVALDPDSKKSLIDEIAEELERRQRVKESG